MCRTRTVPDQVIEPIPFFLNTMHRIGRLVQTCRQLTQYVRNDQIYLHRLPDKYAATLSDRTTDVPIGFSPSLEVNPTTFQGNDAFLSLLQSTIKKTIHEDFTFIMEAGANASTYMPIYDFREVPRYARTPSVDNVFGYVLVDGSGKMIPGSYEPNNLYRLCNDAGLLKLSDHLLEEMKKETCKRR